MKSVLSKAFAALALVLAIACSEEPPRSAADIEAAVENYLAERTDLRLGQLRVKVDRIRYDGDHASASVSIVASDDPKAAMKMLYELRRDTSGWTVLQPDPSMPAAGSATGSGGTAPSLPPGHPPTGPPGEGLPPGHPPLDGGQR